jgi:hypothetical protein
VQGAVAALVVGRSTWSVPSSWRRVMVSGSSWLRVPLGPLTVTVVPSTVTSTPLGTGMGDNPIRDM